MELSTCAACLSIMVIYNLCYILGEDVKRSSGYNGNVKTIVANAETGRIRSPKSRGDKKAEHLRVHKLQEFPNEALLNYAQLFIFPIINENLYKQVPRSQFWNTG